MLRRKELRKSEIESKLDNIMKTLEIIEENLPLNFEEFANSGLIKDGIYKKVEFVIECIIDICNIINSDLRLGMPEEEDDIVNNLEKKKILSKEIVQLIREMKRFWNILIHKYGEINDQRAFEEIRKGMKDFEKIINEIEGFLKRVKN